MRNFKFDRLKFNWAGEWVSNFQYIKDDIVSFQGKSYVCLNSHESTDFEFDNNEFQNDVITFNVTVGIDSVESQSQGTFYIDGEENPELRLLQQRTYIFDQSNSTNVEFNESRNILLLSLGKDGSLSGNKDIDTGVSYVLDETEVTKDQYINGFSKATDKSIRITVTNNSPTSFYYYSVDNKNLGAEITAPYSSNWELMFDGKQWRADWTVSTEYYLGNIVKFRGYLYECIQTHLSTSVASLGVEGDREKWKVYAETYNYRANWQPQTNFTVGDVVKYNGINYLCITSHFSASTEADGLEADQLNWIVFTRSDNWRQDWTTEVKYNVNDVVRYGGIVYRCIESHVSAENTSDGLEFNQASWEIVLSGVEYKQDWQSGFRYKLNDIVKYGSTLWICVLSHQSREELADDEDNWSIWLPGLEYELEWDAETNYQVGDIVYYGGYIYAALNNNLNSIPSQVGLQQNFGNWELVTRSYNFKGNWNNITQYRVGDVVRQSSYLYVARLDNESVYPDSSSAWELLIPGEVVVGEWVEDREYFEGDVVLRAGTAYLCIDRHSSATPDSRPDIDIEKAEPEYWTIFILGDLNNVLVDRGDLKTYDTDNVKLDIGLPGNVLKVADNSPAWLNYGDIDNIFYVSTQGTDGDNFGTTQDAAFRTIKFATDFILADVDNRTPATIFIKTGLYEEQLPISVPSNVALVGDELRSTTVRPAAGFEQSDMFYVRNGSGIRNMSLQGLKGTLGEPNEYLTRRPTAGAYVSLDPGQGPDDESVWIKTKSCYVQNVSTQGEACIGMKIDGALHNGGNRSIVANDFTQILSDGIGYWATNRGRSELVSVFTYYCHIGYLSTNGGILRGTNGNNSYGEFGSVAEGFDETEIVKTASIDNRQNEAQFSDAFTFGTEEQKILAIGYSHAGQDYTSADISFSGTGSFAEGNFAEFRDNAISNVRIIAPEDSSPEGGLNYTNIVNRQRRSC